jgi:hypothetical protein
VDVVSGRILLRPGGLDCSLAVHPVRRRAAGSSYRYRDPWRYKVPEGSQPAYEIALAHFIVSDDVERSRRFYTQVPGGRTIRSGEPASVALANSWIIINP